MLGSFLGDVCPSFCARLEKRPPFKMPGQVVHNSCDDPVEFARGCCRAVRVGVLHIGDKVPHYLLRGGIPAPVRVCVSHNV